MSTIKVDTIATRTGSGNITASNIIAGTSATLSGTLAVTGHAAIGASIVDSSRALSIAGATDGSSGTILNCFNSSLASKFSVRDDGYITTTNNIGIASGKGIDFSANANAAGTTSELLDDYEEGTFSPTMTFGGGSITYSRQQGYFIKVGRLVTIHVDIKASVNANTTLLNLASLPFIVDNQSGWYAGPTIANAYYVNLQSGGTVLGGYWKHGESAMRFHSYGNNTNQLAPTVTSGQVTSIRMIGHYTTQ